MPPRLLATRPVDRLGEQVGQALDDRRGERRALGGDAQHVDGLVPVARGERAVGGGVDAGDALQLVGVDRLAERDLVGAARLRHARRDSTSRSTVILAIRRHVVSLPPVIVIIPLEVS